MTSLDNHQLASISGGGAASAVTKLAGRPFPLIDAATSLYDGYTSYNDARGDGHNVPASLAAGAVGTVRSFTLWDLWGASTPAY
ncbi:MAG TPA: hypothetical protein VGG28_17405 [Kofleriaceae bacterium]|jgi:hypothetical protein